MITKIDIPNFGLFKNYSWNSSVGQVDTFRRLNIIYGRNYSGKTTLSRIFKCAEDKCLHKNYDNGSFSITLKDGNTLTNSKFDSNFRIRVYNSDFVRENLSWLHNDDGTIKPFTILGAKNIELDKQIKEIETKLGSVEEATGLLFSISEKNADYEQKRINYQTKSNGLEEKLRRRANDKIKVDNALFLPTALKKTYTISDIKTDITSIGSEISEHVLTDEVVGERKKLLKEVSLDSIDLLSESKPNFSKYCTRTKELLNKRIEPSIPIIDLVNDHLLQEWARQGIDKHKGKRTTCGFCGNPLSDDLWTKLDAHFSKESEELRQDIESHIVSLEQAKLSLSQFLKLTKDSFYSSLSPKFDVAINEWHYATVNYGKSIDDLIYQLKEREKDIFKERELNEITDVSESVLEAIKAFNALITEHNKKADTLAYDQAEARDELRKANIAQFLIDIDYLSEESSIKQAEKEYKQAEKYLGLIQNEMAKLLEDKRILEAQAKDESKGAELVNQHLSHFFGHNELRLKAEGEGPNIRFKIQRESIDANNLSEGESSLISFCYFVAKIEDELKDDLNSSELIIYIDDPISSLDGNHIFFMFSLIESIIAKPKKYGQLFISTHNLDFLKYLRRLTIPKWKPQPNSGDKPDVKHLIIDRRNKNYTTLRLAPDYLKNYITEFNFLFEQIYKCSTADIETISHQYQYNFGNNMRKFLEAYLFYKYPSHKLSNDERLRKFFDNDSVAINLVNRVINEFSHIGEQFDRGMEPIDVEEINKVAVLVLSRIEQVDTPQYEALLESIN